MLADTPVTFFVPSDEFHFGNYEQWFSVRYRGRFAGIVSGDWAPGSSGTVPVFRMFPAALEMPIDVQEGAVNLDGFYAV